MNGQHGADQGGHQGGQGGQDSHLSFLLNAANGQMGYPGGAGGGGLRYGDASLEEQILQRASALRAEALMQQQQQHQHQQQQRQHQLSAALASFQQQQQLSSLGLNPNIAALMEARGAQEQEALLHRAAALRELGLGGGAGVHPGGGMERLQQLEMGRLEELERRRQQLAALANLSNSGRGSSEIPQGHEQLGPDSAHSTPLPDKKSRRDSTASTEKAKDDLRKTPGTVIVPCRARGMPMDHNFKTAYFVISEDAKHGEDLVCSYFACRNGGVKFRYCAHCMAPVAKRNFCRRHDHGLSAKAGESENHEDDEASMDHSERSGDKGKPDSAPSSSKEKPKTPSKEKDMPGSSLDVLSKAATSSFLMQTDQQKKRKKPSPEEEKVTAVVSQPAVTSDQDADAADLASISMKRRNMWSALLIKRPRTKDPRHLSSWLNEVLTVSDFETPLESPDGAQPKVVRSEASADKKVATAETAKKPREPEAPSNGEANGGSKEKKSGEKEKKRRRVESSEDGSNSSKGDRKSKKEEKVSKKSGEKKQTEKRTENGDKKSSKKSSKESPSNKSEDGFVGSFADWRDRKKEKSKKGSGSLRK